MDKTILYKHDFLQEIASRLSRRKGMINISNVVATTGVPRPIVTKFVNGEIPNTSFINVVNLYKFICEENL